MISEHFMSSESVIYRLKKLQISSEELELKVTWLKFLRIWYNRDMIVNGLEPEFLPQPDRILLRTAQAKALIKEQQKREKSNSRMRKRQPQGQYYELR